jgi:hypothetical protein
MAVKKKSTAASATSEMNYVTCNVGFLPAGVQMTFAPAGNGAATASLSKANYDNFVKLAKNLAPPAGGGGGSALPSGKLLGHKHSVSRNTPTKFAFCLQGNTSWGFVNGGFVGTNAAAKAVFSKSKVSRNKKLVEVTFTPKRKVENYPYDLWLQAKVVGPGGHTADGPSVTVIIDPVIRSGTLP